MVGFNSYLRCFVLRLITMIRCHYHQHLNPQQLYAPNIERSLFPVTSLAKLGMSRNEVKQTYG